MPGAKSDFNAACLQDESMNPSHSDYSTRLSEDGVTGWLRKGFFIVTDSSDVKWCDG